MYTIARGDPGPCQSHSLVALVAEELGQEILRRRQFFGDVGGAGCSDGKRGGVVAEQVAVGIAFPAGRHWSERVEAAHRGLISPGLGEKQRLADGDVEWERRQLVGRGVARETLGQGEEVNPVAAVHAFDHHNPAGSVFRQEREGAIALDSAPGGLCDHGCIGNGRLAVVVDGDCDV